eukprot:4203941-Heterocapsa_arctica.AAC.1
MPGPNHKGQHQHPCHSAVCKRRVNLRVTICTPQTLIDIATADEDTVTHATAEEEDVGGVSAAQAIRRPLDHRPRSGRP